MVRTIRNLRWWMAGLLLLSTIINYIDRQSLSIAAPVLIRLFHLSNLQYARITTSFMAAYAVMPVLGGLLVDWLGTKRGLTFAVLWWSAVSMLHALARGVMSLSVLRFLLGVGEGVNWPGATKAVSEWFPPGERSLAVGFFDSGSSVGAIIAAPLVALLILHYGWRAAFVTTGVLGFFWVVAWQVCYFPWQHHPALGDEERSLIAASQPAAGASGKRLPWRQLLRYRQVWAIMLGRAGTDSVWWFYVFWLPQYLVQSHGFSLRMVGWLAWIPFLFADLGNFAGGGGAMLLTRRGFGLTRSRHTIVLAAGAVMVLAAPAALLRGSALALTAISTWTFAYAAFSTILLSLPADLFEPQLVGSVAGLCQTGAGLGGMLFQLLTGLILDRFHSYLPVFLLASGLPLVAMLVVWRLVPEVKPLTVASGWELGAVTKV